MHMTREREGERKRERMCVCVSCKVLLCGKNIPTKIGVHGARGNYQEPS